VPKHLDKFPPKLEGVRASWCKRDSMMQSMRTVRRRWQYVQKNIVTCNRDVGCRQLNADLDFLEAVNCQLEEDGQIL